MHTTTIGFAMTGSFCTFAAALTQVEILTQAGFSVIPILSHNAATTDTRFGTAKSWREALEALTQHTVIDTIQAAEPIGPQKLLDLLVIAPCTGNTIGKIANGITDTAVTMAAKAHLRNARPVLIGVSTNDALGASAANIGRLLNAKHIFFVPMRQDDAQGKPTSLVANFARLPAAVDAALQHTQLQPLFC